MEYIYKDGFEYKILPEAEGFKNGHAFKGMVICSPDHTVGDEMEHFFKIIKKKGATKGRAVSFHPFEERDYYDMFTGVAYASVDDGFDPVRGMKIARYRAIQKMNRQKLTRFKEIETIMVGYTAALVKEIQRLKDFFGED